MTEAVLGVAPPPSGGLVRLGSFLKIRPGEGRKVLWFALLSGLLQAGVAVGMSAGDALFLTQVGVSQLPYVYIAMPLVLAIYVPAITLLVARSGVERALVTVLGVLIAGGLFFTALLASGAASVWVFYAIKFYAALWYIGLYTLFWNFADRFFDLQDGKRLFALFSAGGAAGAVVGGGLVGVLSQGASLHVLFALWAALSAVAIPVALGIGRRFQALDADDQDEDDLPLGDQLRRTAHTLRRSRYVGMMALTIVSVLLATSLVEYQYLTIFSEGASEQELALLFGTLFAVANLLNLVVNLFVFNRLVLTAGVQNVTLIQPVIYLAVSVLLLLQGGMLAAVAGFFAYHTILTSIDYNNQNLLFNGIPAAVRKEVRTVVEGLAEPFATALAGLFLLAFATRLAPQTLASVGFLVALVALVLALGLRSQFGRAMVANLKQGWLDLAHPPVWDAGAFPGDALDRLRRDAVHEDARHALTALRILWEVDHREAQRQTLDFFQRADADGRREALPLLERLVSEGDLDQVSALMAWVGATQESLDSEVLALLGSHGLLPTGWLPSPDIEAEAMAAVAGLVPRWKSRRAEDRRTAARVLQRLLSGDIPEILAGLLAVGHIQDEPLAAEAARFLEHPAPQVRQQAIWALSRTVDKASAGLVPVILAAVGRGGEAEGRLGLEALRRIGDPASIGPLLAMGRGFSPPLRRLLAKVVEEMGFKAVPAVVTVLRDPSAADMTRGLAARVLARIAFPQLEALSPGLVDDALARATRAQGRAGKILALAGGGASSDDHTPGSVSEGDLLRLLGRFYLEKRDRIVNFALELLSLGGKLPDFDLLSASLRSPSSRERANALETLEQGVSRPVFEAVVPLLQGAGRVSDELEVASGGDGGRQLTKGHLEALLLDALNSPQPLEAILAAVVLRERRDPLIQMSLRERLGRVHEPLLREVILLDIWNPPGRHPISRLLELSGAPFYRELPLAELLAIAMEEEAPEAGDPNDTLARARRRGRVSSAVAIALLGHRLGVAHG